MQSPAIAGTRVSVVSYQLNVCVSDTCIGGEFCVVDMEQQHLQRVLVYVDGAAFRSSSSIREKNDENMDLSSSGGTDWRCEVASSPETLSLIVNFVINFPRVVLPIPTIRYVDPEDKQMYSRYCRVRKHKGKNEVKSRATKHYQTKRELIIRKLLSLGRNASWRKHAI